MEIRTLNIDQLVPADYNPRKKLKPGDAEYEKLKRSLQEFGYVDPVIWNERTGHVIGGHQRLQVLIDSGETEVQVSVVDLDEDREKALNVALNKISGEWDMAALAELLDELKRTDLDLALTGFDADEVDELFRKMQTTDEVKEDDFNVDAATAGITEPVSKLGDIWQLGRHRLMCGDATILSDVEKLADEKLASMIFTDPPYNVDYTGGTSEQLKIKNDKMKDQAFYQFLYDSFINMFAVTSAGGAIYICHADSEGLNFRKALMDSGWMLKQCIIWIKNAFVMGRQDHHWQHEPILYGWKPGRRHSWYGGRKQSTVIKAEDGVFVNTKGDGFQITFNNGIQKVVLDVPEYNIVAAYSDEVTTTWQIEKPLRNGEHPTMKPIKLCARAISNSSRPSDIVLDLFGGSGSTLIACEQLNRICYMMELDPVYCDVIIKRWEEFTGEKAILADG